MIFLDKHKIQKLLPMKECILEMKKLFLLNPAKEILNPLRSKMILPGSEIGILGLMPAYIKSYQVMGVKVLSVFPENYKKGFSSHQGILQLFETKTGKLIASLDADEITAIRTAAVSALMTNLLAIKDAKNLCLLGSGKQAETHLEAIYLVRDIESVTIWSQNSKNAEKFISKVKNKYDVNFKICSSVKEAAKDADIICTITASKTPILFNDYLQQHVHINAVGACMSKDRELNSDVVIDSEVFIDNYNAAIHEAGDILIPSKEENIDVLKIIKADIHEVLNNTNLINEFNKTVFESVGVAIEDIAAGYYCLLKNQFFYNNSCK